MSMASVHSSAMYLTHRSSEDGGQATVATGATAGQPGDWTGGVAPTNETELAEVGYSGAAWTGGDYILVGDDQYYWNGSAWVEGTA